MIEGGAQEEVQKLEVLRRLLKCWKERPHLRLGQLLVNALRDSSSDVTERRIFYIEDYPLIELLERWEPR